MRAWSSPSLPSLGVEAPAVHVHDTASGSALDVTPLDGPARMYVCGITPYDATHLGHAATYLAFDLLHRAWRNAGHDVRYVQNVTDVDDPLLERAAATGEEWTALAERQTELFREDMTALRVLAPEAFVAATEAIDEISVMVGELQQAGAVYDVEEDRYFSVSSDPAFGGVSGWSREEMAEVFPERGGDPDRAGKKDPLDPLVWRSERPGEPAWESTLGRGRPGWHIECSAIARNRLGQGLDVQGGGSDLVFPHHEMSASHAQVVDPSGPFARAYVHAGMVGYQGEKMSKSKGNLRLVSGLRREGVDPAVVRLALLAHHYRTDWEWTDAELEPAARMLAQWREAVSVGQCAPADGVVREVLSALADDLDAPHALAQVTEWAVATLAGGPECTDPTAGATVTDLVDAALGLDLR